MERLTGERGTREWLGGEWVTNEQEATALRSFQPLVVPGLLQTEAALAGKVTAE
ncbi:hypothetical protein GA0070214_102509 [Micromonospora chaiyaphumensis]|uniref:DUF5753 domain-containing protein n=1 Tax=Micromonospora chaiyaphumensis TaxID=307119 RepID=A0A1C4VM07_9ACTN|nr:hypothetical protein GA0070214_102509 [Micromonospora chaiyaphumensis]